MRLALPALVCLAGCGAAVDPSTRDTRADGAAEERAAAPLIARFEAQDASFSSSDAARLAFVVENRGAEPVQLDLDTLGSAILGLEVFDDRGARVLTIPPGTPPRDYKPQMETLAPGASRRFVHELGVFMPPLPEGSYTARVRWRALHSETVRFEID